jgi:hypothetical protein
MTEQDPKAATDDADEGPPAVRRIDPKPGNPGLPADRSRWSMTP